MKSKFSWLFLGILLASVIVPSVRAQSLGSAQIDLQGRPYSLTHDTLDASSWCIFIADGGIVQNEPSNESAYCRYCEAQDAGLIHRDFAAISNPPARLRGGSLQVSSRLLSRGRNDNLTRLHYEFRESDGRNCDEADTFDTFHCSESGGPARMLDCENLDASRPTDSLNRALGNIIHLSDTSARGGAEAFQYFKRTRTKVVHGESSDKGTSERPSRQRQSGKMAE